MTELLIALMVSGALVAGVLLIFLGLDRDRAATKENET